MNPQEIRNAAATMREGWKIAAGREPTDGELLYSLLVARLESSFGKGWSGAMANSNNWGAVQCGSLAKSQGAQCAPWKDTHPDGTKYDVGMRVYATPAEGAADVVRHLTKYRPEVGEVMARKGSLYEFAKAMRESKYYGGFCPQATKAGGKWGYGKPTNPNQVACHEEAIRGYAKYTSKFFTEIASALGIQASLEGETKKESGAQAAGSWWLWALAAAAGVGLAVAWRRA